MSAHTFYLVKGVVGVVGTLLIVWHMWIAWVPAMRWGQRLRYLSLLYASVLLTYASSEQLRQHVGIQLRNVGGLVLGLLIVLAMSVSLWDDHHPRPHRHGRLPRSKVSSS